VRAATSSGLAVGLLRTESDARRDRRAKNRSSLELGSRWRSRARWRRGRTRSAAVETWRRRLRRRWNKWPRGRRGHRVVGIIHPSTVRRTLFKTDRAPDEKNRSALTRRGPVILPNVHSVEMQIPRRLERQSCSGVRISDYHQKLMVCSAAHVPSFHQILWKSAE